MKYQHPFPDRRRGEIMAVFRIEKTRDYTVMANHHLRNTALSLKAKGLLSLMLSLSEDRDYTTKGLARICREGVNSICLSGCSGEDTKSNGDSISPLGHRTGSGLPGSKPWVPTTQKRPFSPGSPAIARRCPENTPRTGTLSGSLRRAAPDPHTPDRPSRETTL